MTDDALPPPLPPPPPQTPPGGLQQLRMFLASDNLLARLAVLGFLTLVLTIPLNMIGSVIADRLTFEAEATKSVSDAWGGRRPSSGR